jgi:carbon monoxide dehydrogenase subunit G
MRDCSIRPGKGMAQGIPMQFEHEFYLPLPIDRAWAVLTDIERIAPCMPGAQLEEIDGNHYKGSVKIRVGPITTQYRGTAVMLEQDAAARRMVLEGKGADSFGQGNAAANAVGFLHDEGERTRVTLTTDLQISGKVAQLGQGVMKDVSAKLLKQFVSNLEKKLAAEGPSPAPAAITQEPPAEDAASTPGSAPVAAPAPAPAAHPLGSSLAALEAAAAAATAAATSAAAAAAAAAAVAAALGATVPPASASPSASGRRRIDAPEAEAIDILQVGGSAVIRRYGIVIAALVAIAVIIILIGVL